MASEPARRLSGTMDVHEFEAFLEGRPQQERWQLIQGNAVMMAPLGLQCVLGALYWGTPLDPRIRVA
ncbi:MAG: hypothetical protein JO366_08795 [Methylobacteriaceae bacterium]|nr:hypothetical protein [Methylobacteriaceae bacterium]MBV9244896.1 hypothetical protein [Methylobacteriaceae bacterium]MBV9634259.1 hypothetical protein [Methylobacteriaceae bacterium]MBV9701552.1 hypothetical protein [Methylobacteriaceae bacterium]